MSDQFTPTTEQVRDGYRFDPEAEYRDPTSAGHLAIVNGYAFDRWLDRVKREAAAEALEEAAHTLPLWPEDRTILRDRAARIRSKATS